MMKKLTTLFALSALALTACTETGTEQNTVQDTPQQQVPEENPFATTDPNTEQPSEDTPISNPPGAEPEVEQPTVTQLPVIQPPVSDPTITDSPGTQPNPPTGNPDSTQFLNGSNADSMESIWVCQDSNSNSSEEVTLLAFFADGSGLAGDEESSGLISWTSSGPYLELYAEGQYIGQLDNVSASQSAGTLSTDYVLSSGESGVLNCQLASVDAPEGTGTGTGAGAGTGTSELLLNDTAGGELNTAWMCSLADGSLMAVFFLPEGAGGLVHTQYPDGIEMTWTNSPQGIGMSLSDGNQVSFSTPQFFGNDVFQVENVNIQGVDVAGMDCLLTGL